MFLRVSSWKEKSLSETTDQLATDEDLIVKVGQGDIRAFETLVARYQKQAIRTAQRFIGDKQEAEDLAQEAFLTIFRKANQYQSKASFKTWFFTILLNFCRNAAKKKKPSYFSSTPVEMAGANDPDSELDRQILQRALSRAVANLPANQRSAFILCHYENFTYVEAAKSLGVSVKAVESLLVRAKRNLREELGWLRKKTFD